MVTMEDVTRAHGPVRALKGVSLEVGRGELVAVMGTHAVGGTSPPGAPTAG
jgi:ABC-type branched-subunit amino acid transport system ATPase component